MTNQSKYLHMLQLWIMISTVTLLSNGLIAQSPSEYLRKGKESMDAGDWKNAFGYFQQAYELDSSDFDITHQYAKAAFKVKQYNLAYELFNKNYSKDNGSINSESLFWIASIQKFNGQYEDAQRNFKKFVKKHKSSADRELIEKAEYEAKSALWAMEHSEDAVAASPLSAWMGSGESKTESKQISFEKSFESTAAPFFWNDRMLFSGYESNRWIIASRLMNSGEQNHHDASQELKIEPAFVSVANPCVYEDKLYFSAQKDNRVVICVADRAEDRWVNASVIEQLNESGFVNTMPFVSKVNSKVIMVFASDREGGEGALDIWLSEYDGKWNKPLSAGKQINTGSDELAPVIMDNKLVFASDGHYGFGGYDLFMAESEGKYFVRPENLGRPLNSSFHDQGFGYRKISDGYEFVLSSNRRTDELSANDNCCNRLFSIRYIDSAIKDASLNLGDIPDSLIRILPVVLYFHNDEPDPRSRDTTTKLSYGDAYLSYMKLLPKYVAENRRGLIGEQAEDAETMTNDFFELQVKQGMRDLKKFSQLILGELNAGKSMRVYVRGFASPRAESDYNLNLTKRRTASLVNELLQDSSGIFKPLIEGNAANGARLEFELLPFGEYKANTSVSDDLMDEKNSIYNRSACLERKIEIEKVIYLENKSESRNLKMSEEEFDFGLIPWFGEVSHDFLITNEGDTEMRIDSVVAECGCTTPVLKQSVLQAGESTQLHVGFNPVSVDGEQKKQVWIYIRGEEPRVITIKASRKK
jgi:tetratricopeptide (TPR) repeat protein